MGQNESWLSLFIASKGGFGPAASDGVFTKAGHVESNWQSDGHIFQQGEGCLAQKGAERIVQRRGGGVICDVEDFRFGTDDGPNGGADADNGVDGASHIVETMAVAADIVGIVVIAKAAETAERGL